MRGERILLALLLWSAFAVGGPESYLEEAKQYLARGEAKAAVIQLKNLLKDNPNHLEGRLLLGEAYLRLGEGAGAVKELEKAKELGMAPERLAVPLAKAYLLQGEAKEALKIELTDDAPTNLRADLSALHGMAQLLLGENAAARQAFEHALTLVPENAEGRVGLARLALIEKQPEVARQEAERVLTAHPDHVEAWLVLAESRRIEGDFAGAREAFSQALKRNPKDVRALAGRAAVSLAQSQFDAAREDLRQAEQLAPHLPLVHYFKGLLAFQANELAAAEDSLLKVVSVAPNHLPSRLLLGVIAYRKNELGIAEEYLTAAYKQLPDHPPLVKLLAAVKMKQGRPKDAIALLEPQRDKLAQDPQFLALLGSAYLQDRQFDKGAEFLTEATRLAPEAAAIRAQLALGKLAAGELEGAAAQLEQAVAQDPKLVQAEVMLVLTRLQQKNYDQALEAARKLADKLPDNPLPGNLIAAAYLAKGETDKAESTWRETLTKHPDYVTAALNLAKLKFRQGDLVQAEKYYQQVLAKEAANASALIGLAQVAEARKDYPGMVRHLEEARGRNPELVEPALMLAKYYLAKREALKALEAVRAVAEKHPQDGRVLQILGQTQLAADQAASAVATFQRLVALAAQDPQSHHLLALALAANKDEDKALKALDQALALKSDYVPAASEKVGLLLRQKRYAEASAAAQKLQEALPNQPAGYLLAGEVALQQGRYDQALQAYQRAHAMESSSLTAQRLYQLYRKQGQSAKANQTLEDWLKRSPQDVGAWFMLAMGYQADGERARAIEAYEKARALAPDNLVVLNNLAWLYQEAGQTKALALAEVLLEKAKDNPEMLDTVGWIYSQQGRIKEGLTLLQEAVVKAPHIPAIHLHLAEAWVKAGNKDEARKVLTRLLKDQPEFAERARAQALLDEL
ncbi:MAG: PEP-CTERM system TPR-repeat protein PrsT [Methylohalobius sp.]|nr:PEP-CTERM system TPR-repeat protein PrsT [Methylohalobius sp.]